MPTSEETIREAAMALASRDLAVIQREGGPGFPEWDRLTRQSQKEYLDQARALAEAGLLRQEMNTAKIASRLEAAWDDGNAMGLDGWVGPERGTEPDEHAIQRRRQLVDRLTDEVRDG